MDRWQPGCFYYKSLFPLKTIINNPRHIGMPSLPLVQLAWGAQNWQEVTSDFGLWKYYCTLGGIILTSSKTSGWTEPKFTGRESEVSSFHGESFITGLHMHTAQDTGKLRENLNDLKKLPTSKKLSQQANPPCLSCSSTWYPVLSPSVKQEHGFSLGWCWQPNPCAGKGNELKYAHTSLCEEGIHC